MLVSQFPVSVTVGSPFTATLALSPAATPPLAIPVGGSIYAVSGYVDFALNSTGLAQVTATAPFSG